MWSVDFELREPLHSLFWIAASTVMRIYTCGHSPLQRPAERICSFWQAADHAGRHRRVSISPFLAILLNRSSFLSSQHIIAFEGFFSNADIVAGLHRRPAGRSGVRQGLQGALVALQLVVLGRDAGTRPGRPRRRRRRRSVRPAFPPPQNQAQTRARGLNSAGRACLTTNRTRRAADICLITRSQPTGTPDDLGD